MDTNTNPTAGEAEGTLSPEGRELLAIICRPMPRAKFGPNKVRNLRSNQTAPKGYHFRQAKHVHVGMTVAFLNHNGEHNVTGDRQVVRIRQDKHDPSVRIFTFPEVKVPSRENPGQTLKVADKFTVKFDGEQRVLVKS